MSEVPYADQNAPILLKVIEHFRHAQPAAVFIDDMFFFGFHKPASDDTFEDILNPVICEVKIHIELRERKVA